MHVVDLVPLDDGVPSPPPRRAAPHLVEPVTVVDGFEDGGVRAQQRLVLELQVLGQGQDDLPGARAGDLVVPVDTSCSTEIAGNVAGSMSWGTRPRTSSAARTSGRGPATRRRRWRRRRRRRRRRSARPARGDGAAAGRRSPRRAVRTGRSSPPSVARAPGGRAADGRRRRRRARRGARPWCRTRSVCGAISSVLAKPTSSPNTHPPDPAGRHRLRVRDHEEQEDQDLGRRDDHPPVVEPAHRRERPAGDHAVARTRRARRHRRRGRSRTSPPRRADRRRRVISSPPTRMTA